MSGPASTLVEVTLDERTIVRRHPDIEQERAIAIHDLLERNHFVLIDGPPGPYRLRLAVTDGRLAFDIRDMAGTGLREVVLAMTPFRRVIRDYFLVCESYYEAIRTAPPSRIEAIDMGRKGLHDEGADRLRERLGNDIEIDRSTARRLFTLVCVLQARG